jgi:uncharacterized protein YkwD
MVEMVSRRVLLAVVCLVGALGVGSTAAAAKPTSTAAFRAWAKVSPAKARTIQVAQRSIRRRTTVHSAYESNVVQQVNDERSRHNLPSLRLSFRLSAAAEYHSRQMGRRGFFEHESPDGSAFWKRVERFYQSNGYRYWSVGENLLWASPGIGVGGAVRAWMNSPGHRANILSREWREVGLAVVHFDSAPGVYGGDEVTIITMDFGVRR